MSARAADATPSVPVSDEDYARVQPGIDLCYQTFGDPSGDPLLLVMGLGGPMTWWNPDFCRELAERGFFVIRFDNRDTGRSTKVGGRVRRGSSSGRSGVAAPHPPTPSTRWPTTPSACSTRSASPPRTSPESRWAA